MLSPWWPWVLSVILRGGCKVSYGLWAVSLLVLPCDGSVALGVVFPLGMSPQRPYTTYKALRVPSTSSRKLSVLLPPGSSPLKWVVADFIHVRHVPASGASILLPLSLFVVSSNHMPGALMVLDLPSF